MSYSLIDGRSGSSLACQTVDIGCDVFAWKVMKVLIDVKAGDVSAVSMKFE